MDLAIIVPVIIVIAVLAIIATGYVKAPPDTAFIISGLKEKPKVLVGRAGIKIPFLERTDTLLVKQISVDIKTNGYVPTKDFIGVDIDAVAKIRVDDSPEGMKIAMKNFLNMPEAKIIAALTDSLQGNMREIIGTVNLKDLCTDRKQFGDEVQKKAQVDMNSLGIRIISCNIQKIEDEKNLIVALGQDNMSQIQKDASIAKAEADRDIAIAEAEAKKVANEAKVASDKDIAEKQNELMIRKSELQKESDTQKAIADAAYEIQKQEQNKVIGVASTNAEIAKQEREVELKQKEAQVKEQTLDAEIKKQAEADRFAAEQKADADLYKRQKNAEAEKYEREREADAQKAQAEALRYAKEQEAAGIRAVGEAEAASIQAKGLAEAESMNKKAEAYAKYNNAAVAEMMIKVLPDIAGKIAEPLTQIDKITIIGGGEGSNGIDQVAGNVPVVMSRLFASMKEATGIDLADIVKAGTYDAKVTKNINVTGLENIPEDVKTAVEAAVIEDTVSEDDPDAVTSEEDV